MQNNQCIFLEKKYCWFRLFSLINCYVLKVFQAELYEHEFVSTYVVYIYLPNFNQVCKTQYHARLKWHLDI